VFFFVELRELREFLRSSWCSGGKAGVSLTLFAGELRTIV
jgi:hypothetical protein